MVYFHTESNFLYSLEGLGIENIYIFYDHLIYFVALFYRNSIYVLWSFVIFSPFWYLYRIKKNLAILNPTKKLFLFCSTSNSIEISLSLDHWCKYVHSALRFIPNRKWKKHLCPCKDNTTSSRYIHRSMNRDA
jgi:hypothetical protein